MHSVAFVIDELEIGGTQRQMLGMATGLKARGWTVRVVCLTRVLAMAPAFEAAGIPVDVMEKRSRLDVRLIATLGRYLKAREIRLVHAFSSTAEFFAGIAARVVGCAFVASVRGFQDGLPILPELGKRLACRLANAVVANSEAGARRAVTRRIVPSRKLRIVPNGCAPRVATRPGSDIRRALSLSPQSPVILSVGRLVWEKDYEVTVAIAARVTASHPHARFLIVGDGPLRVDITRSIERLGVSRSVVLLGERDDVPDLLAASDIYLNTSCSEGLSNAVMEAMAAGLPVVATAVGGTPELVREGETGFLLMPGDTALAVSRIEQLIADARLRHTLGDRARQRIASEYDVEAMLGRLTALYDGITRGAA